MFKKPKIGDTFLRGLYSHFVFDDQRSTFEEQMKALKSIGEFVSTDDFMSMVTGSVPVDGRYFHLSFDDGLGCLGRNAAPILNNFSIPAIVFVNSAVVAPNDPSIKLAWDKLTKYLKPVQVMSWDELKNSGFDVGGHTCHHSRLIDISSDKNALKAEISEDKLAIEKGMGRSCNWFAWPYGSLSAVDQSGIKAIQDAGYKGAFGVYRAPISPGETFPFAVPRHHFEPHWPMRHLKFFALGGLERNQSSVVKKIVPKN
jgi:peptidoglycan/xylan/chitin deacetylase (PgdA/CDA1 family)